MSSLNDAQLICSFHLLLSKFNLKLWPIHGDIELTEHLIKCFECIKSHKQEIIAANVIKNREYDKYKQLLDYLNVNNTSEILSYLFDEENLNTDDDVLLSYLNEFRNHLCVVNQYIKLNNNLLNTLNTSKICVFCLNKSFINSDDRFKMFYNIAVSLNKPIIMVLMEPVERDKLPSFMSNYELFKIYKHQNDGLMGYVTRSLMNEISKFLEKKLNVSLN